MDAALERVYLRVRLCMKNAIVMHDVEMGVENQQLGPPGATLKKACRNRMCR